MYTILVTDSNELVVSVKERIMQRSKLVDNLHFLMPTSYKGVDMSEFTCTMEYVLPVSREYKTEILVKSGELYKDNFEFKLPFDTNLTKEAGKIEIQLTFTKVSMDADGAVKQYVRKAGPCTITIVPVTAWSDVVADDALGALDQRLIQLELMANQLNDISQYTYENKADNITYNESDGTIQLLANNSPIGDKIAISIDDNTDINAIKKLEVDSDGILIATYTDDTTEMIGKVNGSDCVGVYVPSLVAPDKLTFTLQDEPGDPEIVVDIDRTNEWSTEDTENSTSYIWETL
jgi:hypothetical protein